MESTTYQIINKTAVIPGVTLQDALIWLYLNSGGGGGGTPTGPAGGVLAGSYPNPNFAQPMATEAALLAAITTREPVIASSGTGDYWRGDKTWGDFATAARGVVLTGLSTASNAVITATDSVLSAFGKLQAQLASKFDKTGGTVSGDIFAEKETGVEVDIASVGYSVSPVMHGYFANGTKAAPTAVTTGQLLYGIGSRPYDGSAYSAHSTAAIHMIATENHSATNQGTSLGILVTPAGTTEANRKTAITYESPSIAGPVYAKARLSGAVATRFYFQTTDANTGTSFGVVPNGTGTNAAFNAFASSDLANYSLAQFRVGTDTGEVRISSLSAGTGTLLPITSYLNTTKNTEQPAAGGFLVTGGALGYGAGAGGIVTQATSKTTTVVLNKSAGRITMNNAALGAGASVTFQVNNSTVAGGFVGVAAFADGVIDPAPYRVELAYTGTGAFAVRVTNTSGGSLSQALQLDFVVFKGATT